MGFSKHRDPVSFASAIFSSSEVTRRISRPALRRRTSSVPVDADQRRLCQRAAVDVEADGGGRPRRSRDGQLVDVERVDRDVIVVRLARRRTRSAVAHPVEVVADLERSGRQPGSASGILWQAVRIGSQVGDPPAPEAAAGRRIRIENADREWSRSQRHAWFRSSRRSRREATIAARSTNEFRRRGRRRKHGQRFQAHPWVIRPSGIILPPMTHMIRDKQKLLARAPLLVNLVKTDLTKRSP